MTNAELVRRYLAAQVELDEDTLAELRHPEFMAVWPQSGEVVKGSDNVRAIMDNYPGGPPRLAREGGHLIGSEDRWAVSPIGGAYRVAGEGDSWWGDWKMTYPDGREWIAIILIELRDGLVYRETEFWAEPFDAPDWRRQWVERMPRQGEGN